jgi:hypothetical protein
VFDSKNLHRKFVGLNHIGNFSYRIDFRRIFSKNLFALISYEI